MSTPSERAIKLVGAAQNAYGGHAIRCKCGAAPEHWADQHDTAVAIDAAIAEAVREERERWVQLHRLSEELEGCYAGFEIESDRVEGDDPDQFMQAAASAIYQRWYAFRAREDK